MRRNLLTVVGVMALALAVPSAALARHGHGHHHHNLKAKAHHAKFRLVHIGASVASTPATPSTTGNTTTPTTPPTPENAGTVASYTNGVLTLTLNDGSTVSGKVTADTRIGCVKATPTTPPAGTETQPADQSAGEDNGQGDDQSSGDTSSGDTSSGDTSSGDRSQQGDHESGESHQGDQGDGGEEGGEASSTAEAPCDSSALVAGTAVRAAELRIGPGATEFDSVWLVR